MGLTEAEDNKKRWQEYTEELLKKNHNDQDNHDGVITHLEPTSWNAKFQRVSRRDKKAFLRNEYKEAEENNRVGKDRDFFKKIRNTKGTFHANMCRGQHKQESHLHRERTERPR